MRIKQLERFQKVQTHYRMYKTGKQWCTVIIVLAGGAFLSTTSLMQPVSAKAATTTTATVAPTSLTTSAKVEVQAPTTSAASQPASTATSTVASDATSSSTSTSGATTSAGSAAKTTATTTTSATSATSLTTSATSAASPTTSATTSSLTTHATATLASSTAATSSLTTTATMAPVSAPTSTATSSLTTSATTTMTNSTAATSNATSADATATSSATTAVPDATVVTFNDPGIEQAVQTGLGVTGPITVGDIRNFKGTTLAIGTDNDTLIVTGSLAGMQYLRYLPSTALIRLVTQYNTPNIDLTPLIDDHFSEVTIMVHDMAAVNLAPLEQIDPSAINEVQLIGSTVAATHDYQNNPDGMTNAQLAQIAPWLTKIDENSTYKSFNLNDNSLSDFSSLGKFTKMAYVVAIGQRLNVPIQVNFVIGQPGRFQATPITGFQGEALADRYENTWNNGATPVTETPLTNLGNGLFEIPTAYPAVPNANWFAYGFRGIANTLGNRADYININYPNNITFRYDSMIYQAAYWQKAPQVAIQYVDVDTDKLIQPTTVIPGKTIGEAYNFTANTVVPHYTLVPDDTSSPTGSYTQNPQLLTFSYRLTPVVAGGLTVSYVNAAGLPIAPATTIHGNVGDAYTSAPLKLTNYTAATLAANSAPASGTLALPAGTITYQYQGIPVQRTVQYVDTTTGQVLKTTTLTGPYQSQASYRPTTSIQAYTAAGYRLVASDYPTNGDIYAQPTATGNYLIALAHQVKTFQAGDQLPANLTLQRSITETVKYQYPDGRLAAPTVTQVVTFTRQAQVDQVTGAVTYSDWVAQMAPVVFSAQVSPAVSHYQAELPQVAAVPIDSTSPNVALTVTYQPATQPVPTTTGQVTVGYQVAGTTQTLRPSQTLTGPTTTMYQAAAPKFKGYQLVAGMAPIITGQYTSQPQQRVFSYVPVKVAATGTPTATVEPKVAIATAAPLVKLTPVVTAKSKLPQTSDAHQPALQWLGLSLLALTGFLGRFGIVKRRRRH
ncbi:hypothetical protein C5Z26_06195 [Lactobacillus sp. CBA3606]|uniref:MucBP domain-containing protein n=1 Tax=Lactobacillus sp. CBA3606 TaxID=2099789 RepID=UPI000CFD9F39|nr:MucBP domain-containing protein [Lactobacillus sp. CBA3606]AVK63719.1 hypothetical protein C5Z26_06195 [Lactobacillus sp. CBA3606]